MQIAVCDDEKVYLDCLSRKIKACFKEFEIEEGGRSQVQVLSYALILIFIYLQHNQSIIKYVGIMKYNSKLGGIEHGFHEFNEKYVE